MAWKNPTLLLYHGCTDVAARAITARQGLAAHNIQLSQCRWRADFSRGFYTTTRRDQAENWANGQYVRNKASVGSAAVLEFQVDREALAALTNLTFVWEGPSVSSDFWTLVTHCRAGRPNDHGTTSGFYDVVSGPVALPAQTLAIKDCDQFSFHTTAALNILPPPSLRQPTTGQTF